MPELIPANSAGRQAARIVSRSASRNLARLEERTLLRMAGVQADGLVQAEKLKEIDALAREAMTGQAMLRHFGSTVAAGDPFVADDIAVFANLARSGKAEIIADTIDNFSRDARR